MITIHHLRKGLLCFALLAGPIANLQAANILDDTFADGTRNNQNLPTDAAWFVSSAGAVSTTTGAMTWILPSGSFMGLSYFGANSSSPVQLPVGDTLTASIKFTFNNFGAPNTSQGFRIGVFDFADSTLSPKWVMADGFSTSSQGTNVQGYALFQNLSSIFSSASPMDIRKRTTATDKDLLGTSGDWTSQITGPGNTNNFPGFASGGQYSVQFSFQRLDTTSLAIGVTWQNLGNGASLFTSVTDSAASTFNFDGIAIRPAGAGSAATNIVFNEVRVDLVSAGTPASVVNEPQSQSVFTNQSASFTVSATGSAPLSYQWYFNTNTPISYGTNATLTINNAQLTNAGMYSVIVSNAFGSDTSAPAALIVSVPTAPSILAQPQSLTVLPGQSATFMVEAGGSPASTYQWFFNTNTPLAGATDSILTLTNIQVAQAGMYSVVASNFVGMATSAGALLSVNTNPVAPSITAEPASQIVLTGGTANFTAAVAGTAPIYFQWYKNSAPISSQTNATLTLSNVQLTDAGSYTLVASNSVGTATSSAAVLTVTPELPVVNSAYNLEGYGQFTTGGGVLPDTSANYAKVYTATDLANALNSKTVKVIEIMTNLNLGYNEIEASAKSSSEPFRSDNPPLLHPVLLVTGVSVIDVQKKNGLTIFSANGAVIKHAHLNVKNCGNVIIRNLKFDELWEWDEATKGQYDKQNWDFITVGDAGTVSNLWVDHCTFTKAYDGVVDIVQGSYNITLSWCKYTGDDGYTNRNSWVYQQLDSLESNKTSYAMYNFLRSNGFSEDDIFSVIQGHDKTHLIGPNDLDPQNAQHSVTLHHQWFINPGDRLPRLRAGNVHDFNLYVDDTQAIVANRMRAARAAAMSTANQNTLNNTYDFNNFLNGSISTEGGAVLVEKSVYIDCLYPLRNNQTDPSNPEYTGKIQALDTIYQMDSTVIRGNSIDPGNPLGPFQAAAIPFSWNTNSSTPNGTLPYTYTMDDPSQLQAIVTSPTAGAGAGVLTWAKTNWLITTYAPTAPVIVTSPQNLTLAPGNSAALIVVAAGSAPLSYTWYFNTNTILSGATNSTLSLAGVQNNNAGNYYVVVSNSVGSVTSSVATLAVSGDTGFTAWQAANFTAQQLSDPTVSGPNATPANDSVPNLVKYALGLLPFTPVTESQLTSIAFTNGAWNLIYHRPAGITDVIYDLQTSTDLLNWTNGGIIQQLLGVDTNSLQIWGASYTGAPAPARYYQLQLHQ